MSRASSLPLVCRSELAPRSKSPCGARDIRLHAAKRTQASAISVDAHAILEFLARVLRAVPIHRVEGAKVRDHLVERKIGPAAVVLDVLHVAPLVRVVRLKN